MVTPHANPWDFMETVQVAELDTAFARQKANTVRSFLFAFRNVDWSKQETCNAQTLAMALDHLEDLAAMVMNLANRVDSRHRQSEVE